MPTNFNLKNEYEKELLIPKSLIQNKNYKSLNSSAVILYAILLDEMKSRSINEGWVDDTGNLYVVYPTKRMIDVLNMSTSTLSNIKQQLIAHDLIVIDRGSIGKYDRIYVKKVDWRRGHYEKQT